MKNRVIALVILTLSLVGSLYGTKNFLQTLTDKEFNALTPEAIANTIKNNSDFLEQVGEDGETPLFTAIELNRFDLASKLIELGANVNVQNNSKNSPLSRAISLMMSNIKLKNYKNLVNLLVEKDSNISQQQLFGYIINTIFKVKKNDESIKFLHDFTDKLFEKGAQVHEGAIRILVKKKFDDDAKKIITKIITKGVVKNINNIDINKKIDISVGEKDFTTLLHWAVQNNLAQASAALVLNGADLNIVDHRNKTALGYAMIDLHQALTDTQKVDALAKKEVIKKIIERLPDQHALINSEILLEKSKNGEETKDTFLIWAAQNLHQDICKLLIQKGAQVALKFDGKTALQHVLELVGDEDELSKTLDIAFLLWKGHEASYASEDIPLLEAIKSIKYLPSEVNISKLLSDFGTMTRVFIEKVDLKDEKYEIIFIQAIRVGFNLKNNTQLVQWIIALEELLKKDGLNVNKIFQNRTPLHWLLEVFQKLSSKKNPNDLGYLLDVIKKLLKKNPNLSLENNQKQNPLHYAVLPFKEITSDLITKFKEPYLKIIKMLVEHGSPIKNALNFLLDEEASNNSNDDLKKQLFEVIKTIIQAIQFHNSDQLSELKEPKISIRIINLAGQHNDIDFLKILRKYNLDFKDKKITRDNFGKNAQEYLNVIDAGSKEPRLSSIKRPGASAVRRPKTRIGFKEQQQKTQELRVQEQLEKEEIQKKLSQADSALLGLRISKGKCEELLHIVKGMIEIYSSNLGNVKKNQQLAPLKEKLTKWKNLDENKSFLSMHEDINSSGIFNISEASDASSVQQIIEGKIAVINGEIDKITPAEEKAIQEKKKVKKLRKQKKKLHRKN
jgi:ankyrin repeat protein